MVQMNTGKFLSRQSGITEKDVIALEVQENIRLKNAINWQIS